MTSGARKLIVAGALAAAFSTLTISGLGAQTLEVTVPTEPITGGSLAITPPSGTATATVSGSTASVTIADIQVDDTRTVNGSPSTAGWTTSVALTHPSNASMRALGNGSTNIDGSKVTWSVANPEQYSFTALEWAPAVGVTTNTGQSLDAVRDSAWKATAGYGRYRYDGTVSVDLTGAQAGTTYRGTLTHTVL